MVLDRILEVRKCMDIVKDFNIDLSEFYDSNSTSKRDKRNYEIQLDIMLFTRSIFNRWDSCYIHNTEEILYLFKEARDEFGEHLYHHVLDGRIASIVKRAKDNGIKIPPEFMDDYYYFDFKPWNDPNLKYIDLEKLKAQYPGADSSEFN